jgi:predicted Zn-dependent peptidase
MLAEGTTSKSGDEISNAMQLLGTTISTTINGEDGIVSFAAMKDKLEPALALVAADLIENPSFPPRRSSGAAPACSSTSSRRRTSRPPWRNDVFPKVVYTVKHPYGRTADEKSVKAITRADLSAFHRRFFQPGRATITVVATCRPTT